MLRRAEADLIYITPARARHCAGGTVVTVRRAELGQAVDTLTLLGRGEPEWSRRADRDAGGSLAADPRSSAPPGRAQRAIIGGCGRP